MASEPTDDHPLVAGVLPDVKGIDKTFDYLVPDRLRDQVRVGTMVRVELSGRRVGGWVVRVGEPDRAEPARPVRAGLKPIAKVTGWGPPAELVELAQWAAWRWAGKPQHFLVTASPEHVVAGLPARPAPGVAAVTEGLDPIGEQALASGLAVVRVPPAHDVLGIVRAAAARGPALVVTPSVAQARLLAARARRAGVAVALHPRDWAVGAAGATVIGARAAAWAPVGGLAAVVVVDEHDEGLRSESAPTWNARDVAVERARRAGVPCVLVSPIPSLEALALGPLVTLSRTEEREGWPILEIVDRTRRDPIRTSLVSDELIRHLRSTRRVVCVLNTKGRARLLACASCGELARCERCQAAVHQLDDHLECARCGSRRPVVCVKCGASRFKLLRPGVSRLREELAAAAADDVVEVTGSTAGEPLPPARIYVGTEAVLHQVDATDVVAFLDIDAELLAPRYRAADEALGLLARAARLTGGRAGGGRILVQTSLAQHEVLLAVLHADPGRLAGPERARREALAFPPARALAVVSGAPAGAYVEALRGDLGIEVLGPADGTWLVRAPDHRTLADALARAPRPPGRLRVEVDPMRL